MYIDIIFIIIGISFSLFYGLFCKQIWFSDTKITKSRYIHEIWFNFVSSLIGWIFIYALCKSIFANWVIIINEISWQHIILFLVGILGITGLLPHAIWSISRISDELIKRMFK